MPVYEPARLITEPSQLQKGYKYKMQRQTSEPKSQGRDIPGKRKERSNGRNCTISETSFQLSGSDSANKLWMLATISRDIKMLLTA